MAQQFPAAVVFLCLASRAASFKLVEQEEAKYGTPHEAPGDALNRLVRPASADDLARQIDESTEALNSGIGAGVTALNTAFGSLRNGTKSVAHDMSKALKVAGKRIMEIEEKVQILKAWEGNRTRRSQAHQAAALLEQGAAVSSKLHLLEAAQRPRRPPDSLSFEARSKMAQEANLIARPPPPSPVEEEERVSPVYAAKLVTQVHDSTEALNSGVGMGISTMKRAFGELKNGTKAVAHDLSESFKVAGKKIMEFEKKVDLLREREAHRTRKTGAFKIPAVLERLRDVDSTD